jgi:hypothetical protein
MSTPTTTQADVVTAAMGLAKDVAEGRLAVDDLEQQAVSELRALVGDVRGPGDSAWELQVQIARGVLALGGIALTEVLEWAAVMRRREAPDAPDPDETLPQLVSPASDEHSPEAVDAEPDDQVEPEPPALAAVAPEPVPDAAPAQKRGTERYDALAGWSPGGTRR